MSRVDITQAYLVMRGLAEPREGGWERPDWRHIDRVLMENYHWTPQEIDHMTMSEIAVACSKLDDEVRAAEAVTMLNVGKKIKQLSAEEILELARLERN